MIDNLGNKAGIESRIENASDKSPQNLTVPRKVLKSLYAYAFGTMEEVKSSPYQKINTVAYGVEFISFVFNSFILLSHKAENSTLPLLFEAVIILDLLARVINFYNSNRNSKLEDYKPFFEGAVGTIREIVHDWKKHNYYSEN